MAESIRSAGKVFPILHRLWYDEGRKMQEIIFADKRKGETGSRGADRFHALPQERIMANFKVGFLGAGNIAASMAQALCGITDEVTAWAIASRDLEKARAFAEKWHFQKAYGSYEELVNDPEIDLIYVATPHSHHYEHAKLCLEHGKAALVEKSFTANRKLAEELISLSEEKGVFLSEAMWTRFLPARHIVRELMDSGVIGEVQSLSGEFSANLTHIPRLCRPELAGGALLDLGVYALTFASMYFGDDMVKVTSTCQKHETGVDATDEIDIVYRDGRTAHLRTSMVSELNRGGTLYGTKGSIFVERLSNYTAIRVYDREGNLTQDVPIPAQVNGYEYEVLACKRAMAAGQLECAEMPHAQTLEIMGQMDALREAWGVKYPFEA